MCLFENMHVCALCVCLQRPEKGTISGNGMKDDWESPRGALSSWTLNPLEL